MANCFYLPARKQLLFGTVGLKKKERKSDPYPEPRSAGGRGGRRKGHLGIHFNFFALPQEIRSIK